MQSRRTLTRSAELRAEALTLSLSQRERETFGGTVSGSPNRDPRQVRTSPPRSERGEDRGFGPELSRTGEGRFRLYTYGQADRRMNDKEMRSPFRFFACIGTMNPESVLLLLVI